MNGKLSDRAKFWIPALLGIVAMATLALWISSGDQKLDMRVPGTDKAPDGLASGGTNRVLAGKVIPGTGTPAKTEGSWTQFRGPDRDGISKDTVKLARAWGPGQPKKLWSIETGEGYAGPVVAGGRVYLMDYDREKKQDALRCLSFDDGAELWRFAYPVSIKRNHGMSRTVPLVYSNIVFAIGPKCHVLAVNAETGALKWGMDMVQQFGTTVPPWYAGQCPLVDNGKLILAPAGREVLVFAANPETGQVLWKSPNPRGWKMTHVSVAVTEVEGERMYIYSGDKGVAGVSATDGRILWETSEWKISIATVATPLPLEQGRIFLSGGYNAGSMMLQIRKVGSEFKPEVLFRLGPEVFGATQQTPIYYKNHIYGVRPDGKFTCLDPNGKTLWISDGKPFNLGPFVIGDGLIYAVNDNSLLRLIEASPEKYSLLGQIQASEGREAWGPLALTAGRLLLRDLTSMSCFDVR